MEYLFIGGDKDGQRLHVGENSGEVRLLVGLSVNEVVRPFIKEDLLDRLVEAKDETYVKMRIRGLSESYPLFVLKDTSPGQVIEKLIENYRPNRSSY